MTGRTGIVYIQKDRLQLYSPFLSSIIEFRFVPEIVQDLDVINKELLENLIKSFIANNKISPSNLIIVISDSASFSKDFVNPTTSGQQLTQTGLQAQADEFIQNVPFENVSSKKFPLPNGIKAYTTNQELYETVQLAFEREGFIIEEVIPAFVFGVNVNTKTTMDATTANIIIQNSNAMKGYNLLIKTITPIEDVQKEEVEEPEDKKPAKTDKKRLFLLVGVFVVLIIIMIVVYFVSNPPATSGK